MASLDTNLKDLGDLLAAHHFGGAPATAKVRVELSYEEENGWFAVKLRTVGGDAGGLEVEGFGPTIRSALSNAIDEIFP